MELQWLLAGVLPLVAHSRCAYLSPLRAEAARSLVAPAPAQRQNGTRCSRQVRFDIDQSRVFVGPWTAKATWLEATQSSAPWSGFGSCSALVGIRRNAQLLVVGDDGAAELWAGEPDASDGLAIVVEGGALRGVARIPLCGCGERGCGNAGLQLATEIPAQDLPALVNILRQLPDIPGHPRLHGT